MSRSRAAGRSRAPWGVVLAVILLVQAGGLPTGQRVVRAAPSGDVVALPEVRAADAETAAGLLFGGSSDTAARIPVVLVPGPLSDPDLWREGRGGGLVGDLLADGYRMGATLFEASYPNGSLEDAAAAVGRSVKEALAASGAPRADVVAYGAGALAARWYAEFLAPPGQVRTLVMIAPPNRGSFAADALRVALFAKALAGDVAASLGKEMAAAVPLQEPDMERAMAALSPPAGTGGEMESERHLVGDLWIPLMSWYVVHRRLLPDDGRARGEDTFASWLSDRYPDFWALVLDPGESGSGAAGTPEDTDGGYRAGLAAAAAGMPDDSPLATGDARDRAASAGALLTPAYERLLAFDVAEEAASLAQGLADARPPLPGADELIGAAIGGSRDGWAGALWHGVAAWLLDWAGRAVHALGMPAAEAGARTAAAWAAERWWGMEPGDPLLARLVTEYVASPDQIAPSRAARGRGDGPGVAPRTVPANRFLLAWNEEAARTAPTRSTAYVILSGETYNAWRWLTQSADRNDGIVEVAGTRISPGPLDVWRNFTGAFATTHFALPSAPRVREAVRAALDPFREARSLVAGRVERASLSVPAPTVFRVGTGDLSISVDAPEGASVLAAWLPPDGRSAEPLALREGVWRGTVREGYVSLRLAPSGGKARDGTWLAASATLLWTAVPDDGSGDVARGGESEGIPRGSGIANGGGPPSVGTGGGAHPGPGSGVPAPSEVGAPPVGGVEPGESHSASGAGPGEHSGPDGARPGSGARDDAGERPPLPGGFSDGGAPVQDGGAAADPDLPLVRVVLHSRLTTDRKPKLVEHASWSWSFGDGDTAEDADPAHVASDVAHTFPLPGRYHVEATSRDATGRVLRKLEWDVETDSPETTLRFHAESIRAPKVELALEGPEDWLAGRPALFTLAAKVADTRFMTGYEATFHPGERFQVLWERPGDDFVVRGAVTVKVHYRFPDGHALTVYDTYLAERSVDVYATSVVQ